MYEIKTVIDQERRCGWRKPGGYYFVVDKEQLFYCPLLPILLTGCEHCGRDYRFSRAWQRVPGQILFTPDRERQNIFGACISACPNDRPSSGCFARFIEHTDLIGLVWVGALHYRTSTVFLQEAESQGISRRMHRPPRDFLPHQSPVAFAHPRTPIPSIKKIVPAIVKIALPRIEYVVQETDSEKKLEKIAKKGISLVRILRSQTEFEFDEKVIFNENTAN